jgi:hypothetical protein
MPNKRADGLKQCNVWLDEDGRAVVDRVMTANDTDVSGALRILVKEGGRALGIAPATRKPKSRKRA